MIVRDLIGITIVIAHYLCTIGRNYTWKGTYLSKYRKEAKRMLFIH